MEYCATPEATPGVKLPPSFYGGATFHSKLSNWDPFNQKVLYRDSIEHGPGPYRRGLGSPPNASMGSTHYNGLYEENLLLNSGRKSIEIQDDEFKVSARVTARRLTEARVTQKV